MAICTWCRNEMTTGGSCTVDALHVSGRRYDLSHFRGGGRCGDCGVRRRGLHHLGCDLQRCPRCRGQLLSCGCPFDELGFHHGDGDLDDESELEASLEPYGVDGNGCPTERGRLGGTDVIVRRADIPESDITTLNGIRLTTPLRTVIDLAPEVDGEAFRSMVVDCLARRLFTVEEAWDRLGRPDMELYAGAELLRRLLRAMT